MKTLEQLKTFEDACEIEGLDPAAVISDFSSFPSRDHVSMIAHCKLVIIVRAANRLANNGNDWFPNFDDRSQVKWEVWMEKGSSGFRFYDCVGWVAYSYVGSRLCFVSREVGKYVATQFVELYNQYFL